MTYTNSLTFVDGATLWGVKEHHNTVVDYVLPARPEQTPDKVGYVMTHYDLDYAERQRNQLGTHTYPPACPVNY